MKLINKKTVFISFFGLVIILLHNCTDNTNTPQPSSNPEFITTVRFELTDTLTGQKLNYYYRDLDGNKVNNPNQLDTILLNQNRFYKTILFLLNESNPNGIKNVTSEIQNTKDNHIVCYDIINLNTEIVRTDSSNFLPVGIKSNWKTGLKSNGNITLILKHQQGVKNGTCDPGEIDLEIKFQGVIK